MLIYSRLIYQGPSKQAKKKKETYSAQLHKSKNSTIGHKLRKTKNSKNTRGSIDEKRKDFGDENRKDRALNIHTEGQSEQAGTHGQTWKEVKLHIRGK